MKLTITTLVIVEEGQVQDIYHSLNDNQDKAYEEIISHTSYFDINVDDAIYEILTMPREEITI